MSNRPSSASQLPTPNPQSPASYTPPHLAQRILAEQQALEARGGTDGERKTITALFADIKGSMELIEGLDPEDARRLIDPALQHMMDAVHQYEGYVAQSMGDGIFALFGAPLAHEDHAQRAIYAGLRMQAEIGEYADQHRLAGGMPLEIRVGINTGEVVVRSIRKDDLHTDYVPVGHATSLAARMESLAKGGSIVVSQHTHRLTDGYFQFNALGAATIKGVSVPVHIYEVVGVESGRTRLQIAARRGLTRFIGRQQELDQLKHALVETRNGKGQIVGVVGEAGVGKSRLIREFIELAKKHCLVLETTSFAHSQTHPYLPVVELLKKYFQITPQDGERMRREKVTGKVLTLDRSLEETLPYLFVLLGIVENDALLAMDPQIRRQRTFDALRRLFVRESLNQPLVLLFEDLHWIDKETQALFETLNDGIASTKILLLTNYRPEYQPVWSRETVFTQLRLTPLGKAEAEELLDVLLGKAVGTTQTSPLHNLKQRILEKTEGIPFFIEEVVQTLVEERVLGGERGNYHLEQDKVDFHIPPTVQGILAARIDRLAIQERSLLQTFSVVGREFSLSLLRKIVGESEDELRRVLARLHAGEFLYEQPTLPENVYVFKHALTQEVAYGSLLTERRVELHARIAKAIEEIYSTHLEDHYSDLAHHYSHSSNTEKAVAYLSLAGQQAVQRSANADAIQYLTQGIELLQTLPESPERVQQELAVRITLGTPLVVLRGYTEPEVEQNYQSALELCHQVGETPQLFLVLFGLWRGAGVRGDSQTEYELAQQGLRFAQNLDDPNFLLAAHLMMGLALSDIGQFAEAQVSLEQSIALYNSEIHRPDKLGGSLYGQDPKVVCLSFLGFVLWGRGYPDQAQARGQEAVGWAQEIEHPFSLVLALDFAASIGRVCRDISAVQENAEAVIALSTAQGFPFWTRSGTFQRGWALAQQEQAEEGVEQVRSSMTAWRQSGAGGEQWFRFSMLAEAYQHAGQIEKGLETLAEGITIQAKKGATLGAAELYRLKGVLTLESKVSSQKPVLNEVEGSKVEEAEECFQKALSITRAYEAKSWELRAATSLAQLWQQQGKMHEAYDLLSGVYAWFTEGFETADLQDAKAVLEQLQ